MGHSGTPGGCPLLPQGGPEGPRRFQEGETEADPFPREGRLVLREERADRDARAVSCRKAGGRREPSSRQAGARGGGTAVQVRSHDGARGGVSRAAGGGRR